MPISLDKQMAVADVYAEALYGVARERNKVAEVRAELQELRTLTANNPDIAAFFDSPAIDDDVREALLIKWFRGRLSDETLNAFLVMNRHGRVGMLAPLLDRYVARVQQAAGEVEATAVTAVEPDSSQKAAITAVAAQLSGKKPLVSFHVEPAILGGLILQIGDVRFDNSVRTQLADAMQRLGERSERGLPGSIAAA